MAMLATPPRRHLALTACVLLLLAGRAAAQAPAPDGTRVLDALQSRAQVLHLSAAQLRRLNALRLDAQIADLPLLSERQVLELKLRRQQLAGPQPAADDPQLQRLEQLDLQIARAGRETARRAYAILTPAQRSEALQFDTGPPAVAPGAPAAAAPAGTDAKLVEFETSEAIADRLTKWAQLFGLFVAVPLGILAAILAVLGVRSFTEFRERLQKAREGIEAQMAAASGAIATEGEAARAAIRGQMQEAAALQEDLTALRARLGELSALEQSVREMGDKVDRIEQFMGFENSAALTPSLQATLERAVTKYRHWLIRLGADAGEPVRVLIDDKPGADNAYYEPGRMVIAEALAGDPDVLLREYTHHILHEARRARGAPPFTAIQSGLSDYLPCSFNDTPVFAAKSAPVFNRIFKQKLFPNDYLRHLVNDTQLTTLPSPAGVSEQEVGAGWGGAFWELRARLGQAPCDRLLLAAWSDAKAIADTPEAYRAFAGDVVRLVAARHPAQATEARAIFRRRGIALRQGRGANA